jgi:hypothetical protein
VKTCPDKKFRVDFSTKSTIFNIGTFHISHIKKRLFCILAIFPFPNIPKNLLENFTLSKGLLEFCIPERETPQPVLP